MCVCAHVCASLILWLAMMAFWWPSSLPPFHSAGWPLPGRLLGGPVRRLFRCARCRPSPARGRGAVRGLDLVSATLSMTCCVAGSIGCYSGCSRLVGLPASARIIHAYHVEVLRLACRPWLGFVYSEDNFSDDPSRGRFDRLLRLGARERDCVFPADLDWHL